MDSECHDVLVVYISSIGLISRLKYNRVQVVVVVREQAFRHARRPLRLVPANGVGCCGPSVAGPLLPIIVQRSLCTTIMATSTFSLDEEVRLYTSNAEREKINLLATLFGIIVALDYLERAYVRDSITAVE